MEWRRCRITAHVTTQIFVCLCIILIIISIIFPAWQTVGITEWKNYHEHGLWRDCWKALNPIYPQQKEWICTYKFNQPATRQELTVDTQDNEAQHLDLPWLRSVLGLMICGATLSFIGLFFSIAAFWYFTMHLVWNVFLLLGMCCSAAGIIYYFREGYQQDYLYIVAPAHVYQQQSGYSYWCAVAASIMLLLCTFVSFLTTACKYVEDKGLTPEDLIRRYTDNNHQHGPHITTITKLSGEPRRPSPPVPPKPFITHQFRSSPNSEERRPSPPVPPKPLITHQFRGEPELGFSRPPSTVERLRVESYQQQATVRQQYASHV